MARDEPAFRVNALAALSAMDDATAYDALRSLLEVKSAETRYGAFRSLWAMNQHDPLLHDENLGDAVPLPCAGRARARHGARDAKSFAGNRVVRQGSDSSNLPLMLDAGKSILVNGMKGDKITVSQFRSRAGAEAAGRFDAS